MIEIFTFSYLFFQIYLKIHELLVKEKSSKQNYQILGLYTKFCEWKTWQLGEEMKQKLITRVLVLKCQKRSDLLHYNASNLNRSKEDDLK